MADLRLIPAGIRDAGAVALNELIDRIGTLDISPVLIYWIDEVVASALPHLIEQFHVAGFEGGAAAMSDDQRRRLIKRAIELHRHKGTPWALKEAFKPLGVTLALQEWWEYGGDPYHFMAEVQLSEFGANPDTWQQFGILINEWKNVRSWLDSLTVSIAAQGEQYIGGAVSTGMIITVYPWITTEVETDGPCYVGGVCQTSGTITVYPPS